MVGNNKNGEYPYHRHVEIYITMKLITYIAMVVDVLLTHIISIQLRINFITEESNECPQSIRRDFLR